MAESGLDKTRLPGQCGDLVYIGCQCEYKKCTVGRAGPGFLPWNGSGLDQFLLHSIDPARGGLAGCVEACEMNPAIEAIQSGDVGRLKQLLREDSGLISARVDK